MLPGDPYHWGVGTRNTRPYICIYICMYVYTTLYTHAHTHIYTYLYIYVYIYVYIYICIYICMYIYIYVYMYIYIYNIHIIAYVYAYPSLIMFASKTFSAHVYRKVGGREGERGRDENKYRNSIIYIMYACILYINYLI